MKSICHILLDHSYSLKNTCAIDSALFAIYFIYMTDEAISSEFKEAPESSPYAILEKTFNIVEKEGWDVARVYWPLKFNILKRNDKKPKDLFGSVDELVFAFVKNQQSYSSETICSRPDCIEKERKVTSTELDIL